MLGHSFAYLLHTRRTIEEGPLGPYAFLNLVQKSRSRLTPAFLFSVHCQPAVGTPIQFNGAFNAHLVARCISRNNLLPAGSASSFGERRHHDPLFAPLAGGPLPPNNRAVVILGPPGVEILESNLASPITGDVLLAGLAGLEHFQRGLSGSSPSHGPTSIRRSGWQDHPTGSTVCSPAEGSDTCRRLFPRPAACPWPCNHHQPRPPCRAGSIW